MRRAAGEFDVEVVGLIAVLEASGFEVVGAEAGDVPEEPRRRGRFHRSAVDDEEPVAEGDFPGGQWGRIRGPWPWGRRG